MAVTAHTGDLAEPNAAAALVKAKPDIVFHLAGIVSGEAESNFDLGYRVNFDGTRALFDAVRLAGHGPRVVYTSSIAVFGAPFPDVIYDDFQQTPLTSYGTQKLVGELILADYTRRGFFDGVGIRLPTICVRPGKANKAASSFFSGIIREPLAGGRGDPAGAAKRGAHTCQPALGGEFPCACSGAGRGQHRPATQHHHARRRRHRRRTDRVAPAHRRR